MTLGWSCARATARTPPLVHVKKENSTPRVASHDRFAAEGDPVGDLAQRLDGMKAMAQAGMPETLANLKAEAEAR